MVEYNQCNNKVISGNQKIQPQIANQQNKFTLYGHLALQRIGL